MSFRVLHVLESSNPDAGSVTVCLGGLYDTLAARGVQCKTIAPPADPEQALDGVDVVHIHGWDYQLARLIATAALKAGKPYIIAPHGSLTYGPFNKPTWKDRFPFAWRARRLIRGAACLTALHQLEERDICTQRLHSRILVLPYGLNIDEYAPTATAGGVDPSVKGTLLMLGSLHPRGGCVALLKAIAEIGPDFNGWNVVLAGRDNGQWRTMLESAIRRKKADDRVTFASTSTIAEQRALLASASLLASPGLHTGVPVSIMQAVACGVPVIASTCTAPPGLDGAIQTFAPRREELREALRLVLKLPEESRRSMAERARTAGRAAFDWSVLADQYARLYRGIMES